MSERGAGYDDRWKTGTQVSSFRCGSVQRVCPRHARGCKRLSCPCTAKWTAAARTTLGRARRR